MTNETLWLQSNRSEKAILIWSILAVCLVTSFSNALSAQGVRIRYDQMKSNYLTAEPIIISAEVFNESSDTVTYRPDSLWRLMIVDQSNRQTHYRGPDVSTTHFTMRDGSGNSVDPRRTSLAPGTRSKVVWKNISEYYGHGDDIVEFYLPPGSYRIWNSHYSSNALQIIVADPTDSLDYAAMTSLTDALNHSSDIFPDGMFPFYSDFYEKCSAGPYAERALRTLVSLHPSAMPGVSDSAYQYFVRTFILRFPESKLVLEAIPNLEPKLAPLSQLDSIRKVIALRYQDLPTERQRNMATQMRRELEK